MTYNDVLKTIKSKGYWRISFEPLEFDENKLSLAKCKELVEENSVHLRGWDYPHIPGRLGEDTALEPGNNYWQGWLDWQGENHKEFWRMYQSSQFIHYLGLREDWIDSFKLKSMWQVDDKAFQAGQAIGVISTTYQITEIFEFLSRLMANGLYAEGVNVSISLNNTQERNLIIEHFQRIGFSTPKKTSSPIISFTKQYTKEVIMLSPKDKALEVIVHFFERFGWSPPNIAAIKSDQENFLAGKV